MHSHPVQLVFERMTKIVGPAMPEPSHVDKPCSYCGRAPSEFDHKGYSGKDSYKQPISCCPACESFSIGDINIMGVESIRGRGNKVANKFGMWPGVSAVFEVNSNRAVLLPPQGVYDKLPEYFIDRIETIVMPKSERVPWIIKNLDFPLLYIAEFGKTTSNLIANMRISESPSELMSVSDKGVERIHASACLEVHACLAGVAKKEVELFFTTVRNLATGSLSPRQANTVWSEHPNLATAARALPIDPHQRLSLLSFVRSIRA